MPTRAGDLISSRSIRQAPTLQFACFSKISSTALQPARVVTTPLESGEQRAPLALILDLAAQPLQLHCGKQGQDLPDCHARQSSHQIGLLLFSASSKISVAGQSCIARLNKDGYTSQLTAFLGTCIHSHIHHSKTSFPSPYLPAQWASGLLVPFFHADRAAFSSGFLFWVGPSKGVKESVIASVKLRLLPDR